MFGIASHMPVKLRRVFLDLDGVLADFDGHYHSCFGIETDRDAPEPPGFWDRIEAHGEFFATMPPLPRAQEFYESVWTLTGRRPSILTGVPRITLAESHKRDWVRRHIGLDADVICCRSRDKRNHGRPGDILIDDWKKYRHLWEEMGGVFILHASIDSSLAALESVWRGALGGEGAHP